MQITDYLVRAHVFSPLPADDRSQVIRAVIDNLVACDSIPDKSSKTVVKGILERESLGSTGIGRGVAIPHMKSRVVEQPVVAFARLADPIDYDAVDGAPVHSLFFVVSPQKMADEHLAILKWVTQIARSSYYTNILRNTSDPDSLHELFCEIDGQQ